MSATLAAPARFESEVRKSRFLALATPASTPDLALRHLATVADRAATHNCWAYRIGQQYRFNDDGEPGGTAGKPILAAIDSQGLDQVMVVVTRWYGGIKLGAGGLVRAYGGVAAECLRLAGRRALVTMADVALRCDFAHAGTVHGLLPRFGAIKQGEGFDSRGMRLRVSLPLAQIEPLRCALRDATRGQAELTPWRPPTSA